MIEEGDSVVVLESDKASMEVPSPAAGEVLELLVTEGASVNQGAALIKLSVRGGSLPATVATSAAATAVGSTDTALKTSPPVAAANPAPEVSAPAVSAQPSSSASDDASDLYVGPAVRKLAREFGVDLKAVKGQAPRGASLKKIYRRTFRNVWLILRPAPFPWATVYRKWRRLIFRNLVRFVMKRDHASIKSLRPICRSRGSTCHTSRSLMTRTSLI